MEETRKKTIKITRDYLKGHFGQAMAIGLLFGTIIGLIFNETFPKDSIKLMQNLLDIDISKYKLKQRKDQILRNCVDPELGLHIFNCAFKEIQKKIEC